ncbi:macro domain-containing protein [Culicoidibacter larvae]|uniref:Thoeris protein ThsA Macro domain-containing protein n=1 Tax=Culicoidibacter larvae TaxID=2579976 RepID=A0A5R8Q6P7_9FIRM|nr:hypothetical protein FEZ08_11690 [Culicoidibacter larvae]
MKVQFLDKNLLKQFARYCGVITTIISFLIIFYDIPPNSKILVFGTIIILLLLIYIVLWITANIRRSIILKIGSTTVEIKPGDIFQVKDLKAIAFNEFFDTQVDDKVIASASLNGQVLINHISDIPKLDEQILNDEKLIKNIVEKDINRFPGKSIRYKLGSCILVQNEFIFTAFSRFNSDFQAEITIQEYVNFLLTFWNEVNRLYAQRSVTVPIFGAGITRFKNGFEEISIEELLKIMVWTFKISKIKFAYPAKLTILVHEDLIDRINLYEIKESEQNDL